MGGLTSCNDSVRSILAYQRKGDTANSWDTWIKKEPQVFGTSPSRNDTITFSTSIADRVNFPHNDPLVVEVMIADCEVSRVLIDTRISVNLIFQETLQKMKL